MLLIRDIMYCKPGKVRPMVEKFVAMSRIMEKYGTLVSSTPDSGRMRCASIVARST